MEKHHNESAPFEFGVYSLGELIPGPSGQTVNASKRIEEIITAVKLADGAGLDLFGIGEHHRLDFVTSSYAMILSAIAQATKRIRLTSTLSVIINMSCLATAGSWLNLTWVGNRYLRLQLQSNFWRRK